MIRDEDGDDRLMERAVSGDTAAFDRIVQRHQHRLQRFATRMLGGDQARGGDIAVGALLRLWESRHSYRPCGRLEAWLIKTANRMCLDALSRDPAAELLENDGPQVPSAQSCVERSVLARVVRDAVMELPTTHRNVLILSVYEELSYDEIAEALEISEGTVASRKNHAIAMLRRRLAAWETR